LLITIVAVPLTVGALTLVAVIITVPADTAVITPFGFTVAIALSELVHVTEVFVALAGVIVAVAVAVFPTVILVGACTEIAVGRIAVTVIVALPLTLGAAILVAIIFAVPGAIAVTTPLALTVATAVLELLHVTVLSPAFAGFTVAVAIAVDCTGIEALFNTTVIDDGNTAFTITCFVAVTEGSATLIAVIVTVPSAIPVTTPEALIDAIELSELIQVISLFVALFGVISAVNVEVAPTSIETVVAGLIVIAVGSIEETVKVALPLTVGAATLVAVIIVLPADNVVITPFALTVATAVLELDHVTFWFVAFAGVIAAVAVDALPI